MQSARARAVRLIALVLSLGANGLPARGQAALLTEEPYGFFGALNPNTPPFTLRASAQKPPSGCAAANPANWVR